MKKYRLLTILISSLVIFLFSFLVFAKEKDHDTVTLPYIEKLPMPVETKPLDIVSKPVKRRITAYNLTQAQTDGDPCTSASGVDICPLVAAGELICAANFVPFGTILRIDSLGDCIVLDRMNERYPYDVDVAMPADKYGDAKEFGVKWLGVGIVYRK
jgi:3D (Asp-Asp-Asp) domain-containing protein